MEHRALRLKLAGLLFVAAFTLNAAGARAQTHAPSAAAPRAEAATADTAVVAPQPQALKDESNGESRDEGVRPSAPAADATTAAANTSAESAQPLRRAFGTDGRAAPAGLALPSRGPAILDPAGAQGGSGGQQTYTPLSAEGKMKRAFKRAFLSPEGYARSAISAAITEWGEEDLPHKDTEDRVADGLSRFAIKSATRATRTMFGSGFYAVLFKQDPRYERAEGKSLGRRILHAASRVWVTRGDDGRLKPNYSRWAGSLTASALSNIWEQSTPGHDRKGVDATFRRFGSTFISDTWQTIVFSELLPDLMGIFRR